MALLYPCFSYVTSQKIYPHRTKNLNTMRFQQFDSLRLFVQVAKYSSFTQAADVLHMTKGAISYQIQQLESALGFAVFLRQPRGVQLTDKGQALVAKAEANFLQLHEFIDDLRDQQQWQLTVGMSSYFAARWLAPRLVNFMYANPHIDIRLQPLADQEDSLAEHIDVAIRWGDGNWQDVRAELLWLCAVFPCAGKDMAASLRNLNTAQLQQALNKLPRLRDRGGSEAWSAWMHKAGLRLRKQGQDHLIISDPAVRLLYVMNNQGLGLYDELAQPELDSGMLQSISDVALDNHGYYLVYPLKREASAAVSVFRQWMQDEVASSRWQPTPFMELQELQE
jgi:DNA-binding transcriptional LysR family regulator